jgi:hypothetical protein
MFAPEGSGAKKDTVCGHNKEIIMLNKDYKMFAPEPSGAKKSDINTYLIVIIHL